MFVEIPAQQDHHQDDQQQTGPDQGQLQRVDAVVILGVGEEVDVSQETLRGAPHWGGNVQDVRVASALAAVLSAARLQPCGGREFRYQNQAESGNLSHGNRRSSLSLVTGKAFHIFGFPLWQVKTMETGTRTNFSTQRKTSPASASGKWRELPGLAMRCQHRWLTVTGRRAVYLGRDINNVGNHVITVRSPPPPLTIYQLSTTTQSVLTLLGHFYFSSTQFTECLTGWPRLSRGPSQQSRRSQCRPPGSPAWHSRCPS